MKVKMIKFGWLLMAVIAAILCFKQLDYYVDNKSNSPLALVDVEILANGEDVNFLPPCHLLMDYEYMDQVCYVGNKKTQMLGRETIKYKCNPKGANGMCKSGEDYIYYDCVGNILYADPNSTDVPCTSSF